jgi:hypothetical protein
MISLISQIQKWKAEHPFAKVSWGVAGGKFQSEYPAFPDEGMSYFAWKEVVLNKIVADYNRSGNPGKFRIQKDAGGRYVVVGDSVKDDRGQDIHFASILDTPISIPKLTRTGLETIHAIFVQLSLKTSIELFLVDNFTQSPLQRYKITLGAEDESARSLILKTISSGDPEFAFDFFYMTRSGDSAQFALNIFLPAKSY